MMLQKLWQKKLCMSVRYYSWKYFLYIAAVGCPPGLTYAENMGSRYCYGVHQFRSSWDLAEGFCHIFAKRSKSVMIPNAEEHNVIRAHLAQIATDSSESSFIFPLPSHWRVWKFKFFGIGQRSLHNYILVRFLVLEQDIPLSKHLRAVHNRIHGSKSSSTRATIDEDVTKGIRPITPDQLLPTLMSKVA